MACHYFHTTEGRGNNCVVEPFRRGDLDHLCLPGGLLGTGSGVG